MSTKVVIPVADFNNHDCKLGPEGSCAVCQARELFYRRSREKWNRFLERTGIKKPIKPYVSDPAVVAAILTPTEEDKPNANT